MYLITTSASTLWTSFGVDQALVDTSLHLTERVLQVVSWYQHLITMHVDHIARIAHAVKHSMSTSDLCHRDECE